MKEMFKLTLSDGDAEKTVSFGMPSGESELHQMHKLRYDVYLKKGYIEKNSLQVDKDDYDDGRSIYFIAMLNSKVIGTVRIIRDTYLPTEKDCFKFDEPLPIRQIDRGNRYEIGRLVAVKPEKSTLPRHLVTLGLARCIVIYAGQENLTGGYAFIKDSLKKKLDKVKFPYHLIVSFKKIYNDGVLSKYFASTSDLVWPIYFLSLEMEHFIGGVFENKFIFAKKSNEHYHLKSRTVFNVALLVHVFK